MMRCASYCTADLYDINRLSQYLRDEGLDPKFYDNVIFITKEYDDEKEGSIFIFPYGCLSFWGLSESEELHFIQQIKPFELKPNFEITNDVSTFDYASETSINEEDDEILLESDDTLIKLSISHGLTQSVKLEVFEFSIIRTIENTRHLPEELSIRGKTSLSRKRLSKKIGALFAERNSITLHTDILDTPEFFWRRPRYKTYYLMATEYLDITQRIDILNRRLEVIHELYDILSNELKHAHSSYLEWIVILLIVSEVIMHLLKDILKWI